MTLAVALFGCLLAALGGVGVVSPRRLLALVTRLQSRLGLAFIAGLRLAMGAVLVLAAEGSRAPLYLRVLGCVALISGLVTPLFGVRRFEAILGWWSRRPSWLVRSWACAVLALGVSIVWAVLPAGGPG